MPTNYAQTNILRCSRSKLVGILDNPVRPTAGTPWSDAGVDVRKRVYAVREESSVATRFVSIDGRTVASNRKWTVTRVISGLCRPHRHAHHRAGQRMQGIHRCPNVGAAAARTAHRVVFGAAAPRPRARRAAAPPPLLRVVQPEVGSLEALATAAAARLNRAAASAAASRTLAAEVLTAAEGALARGMSLWSSAVRGAEAIGLEVPPLALQHQLVQLLPPRPPLPLPPLLHAAGFDVSASTPSCAICLDEEKLACCVWSACGHRCACLDCAHKCTALGARCPICRAAGFPIAVRDVQRALA